MYFSSKRRTVSVFLFVELVSWLIAAQPVVAIEFFGSVIDDTLVNGYSVSFAMSADGTTIAVGAGTGGTFYSVRVYSKNGPFRRKYEPIGQDINVPVPRSWYDVSLVLSAEGTTIAVAFSAVFADNKTIDTEDRCVRVYQKDSSNLIYKEIEFGLDRKGTFISEVAMSADGTTIAVRAPFSTVSDVVRVYQKDSSNPMYEQIGSNITVAVDAYYSFGPLAMSADGTIIAAESPSGRRDGSGRLRVYQKDTSNQVYYQIGSDIIGESLVAMSGDGTTIVTRSTLTFGYIAYQKDSSDQTYKQIGGIAYLVFSPSSNFSPFSISTDGTRMVVGGLRDNSVNDCSPYPAQVRLFQKDSSTQTFKQIEFLEIPGDHGQVWTSITGDGKRIAAGVFGGIENKNDRVEVFTTKRCVFGFDNFFCPFSFRAVLFGFLSRLRNRPLLSNIINRIPCESP